MNLVEILERQASVRPDAPAIIEHSGHAARITTFADLNRQVLEGAALLRMTGMRAGDVALVFQPMSAELYVVLLALFKIGVQAMLVDPSAGSEHLEACCERLPPRALIASPKAHLLRLWSKALRRVPIKFVTGRFFPGAIPWSRGMGLEGSAESCDGSPEMPALITFTSGSTGAPKAAVRTHGFLLAQHSVLARHLDLEPGEVDLTCLPVFLLANLASGVTSVIPDGDLRSPARIDPEPLRRQILEHGITRCAASPAFFERLIERNAGRMPSAHGPLERLEKVFTGGAPVFPRLLAALAEAMPHAAVHAVYGSTEAEPIAHFQHSEMTAADRANMARGGGLLAGRVVPEIGLRIMHEQWGRPLGSLSVAAFNSLCLEQQQAGEIVVSGRHVIQGYLGGLGDEETKFHVAGVAWHRTGDAGMLDADGRLWLLGRCSAKIEDARGVLWPFAVECAAMEEPGVRRAALVASGSLRLLVVELDPNPQAFDPAHLERRLSWAQLDEVRPVRKIPLDRRHNAKVDYPALERMLQFGRDG